MNFWLIQRMNFKDTKFEEISGVDSLLAYDYMGSAEFEFGALGESLREICKKLYQYQWFHSKLLHAKDGCSLDFICLSEQYDEVYAFLAQETREPHRLKEPTYLKEALRGEKFYTTRCRAWWDIQNHWIAYLGQNNEVRIMAALQKSAAKLREKGKI